MRYKDRLKLSMEDNNVLHHPGPLIDAAPPKPASLTEGTLEQDSVQYPQESVRYEDALDALTVAAEQLITLRAEMHKNASTEPLTVVAAEAYNLAMDYVTSRVGLKNVMVSAEAYFREPAKAHEVSMEAVGQTIKKVVDRVLEVLSALAEKIQPWLEKLAAGVSRMRKRAESTEQAILALPAPPTTVHIDSELAGWLIGPDNKIDLQRALSSAQALAKAALNPNFISQCAQYVGELTAGVTAAGGSLEKLSADVKSGKYKGPAPVGYTPKGGFPAWAVSESNIAVDTTLSPYQISWVWRDIKVDDQGYDVTLPSKNALASLAKEGAALLQSLDSAGEKAFTLSGPINKISNALRTFNTADEAEYADVITAVVNSARSYTQFPLATLNKVVRVIGAILDVIQLASKAGGTNDADAKANE